jgi:hypothetical protein
MMNEDFDDIKMHGTTIEKHTHIYYIITLRTNVSLKMNHLVRNL